MSETRNNRILIIDDNQAIHNDIRKILTPPPTSSAALDDLEAELLGKKNTGENSLPAFELTSAFQGREGLELIEHAVQAGRPYAMAFVDVRMPPGWDGVETIAEIWKIQPDLQIVICTAYSDYSWNEMMGRIGGTDRLLILKKPFDTVEVLQLACSLTGKWNLLQRAHAHAAELERQVNLRTAELQKANDNLQHEIDRRTQIEAELKYAKERAESADRAKSAFLANMSHEIRTPMNGVIGMTNLLTTTTLTNEQRDLVNTLAQSCEALLNIINDILDISKIEAGHLTLESLDFSLAEQVQQVLDLQDEAIARKKIELVLDLDSSVPSFICGDPARLRQILLHLVSNAVKFTEKGEVVLRIRPHTADSGLLGIKFEIQDTGIGFTEQTHSLLFQPFTQGDITATRKYGGNGLGLAICKHLTNLMRGEIGAKSTPGQGSTFWFTIQVAPSALSEDEAVANASSAENRFLSGRRILAVDDNETSLKLIHRFLTAWDAEVQVVNHAEAALRELKSAATTGRAYELVILDQHMPDMDGLNLAAALQADPEIPNPILILLTSRVERLTSEQMKKHALAPCELKPMHGDTLKTCLQRLLSSERITTTQPPVSRPPKPPSAHILVAEDNPVNQKVTLMLLDNLGYSADVVRDGDKALAALKKKDYHLVLMDANMPNLDGLEATRLIRAAETEGTARLPIIALTASAMPEDRAACIEAGMDDFLTKPVRLRELSEILSRYLPAATLAPKN